MKISGNESARLPGSPPRSDSDDHHDEQKIARQRRNKLIGLQVCTRKNLTRRIKEDIQRHIFLGLTFFHSEMGIYLDMRKEGVRRILSLGLT